MKTNTTTEGSGVGILKSFFSRHEAIIASGILVLLFTSVSLLKISSNQSLPKYNASDDTNIFRTEGALHYYLFKTVARGESVKANDLRAQYPEGLEIFNELTMSMEWVAGYGYRLFAWMGFSKQPHVFLIYFIALFSSLSIFAAYLIAGLVWQSRVAGLFSALFFGVSSMTITKLIGNYPRESFALPLIYFGIYFFLRSCEDLEVSGTRFRRFLPSILSGLCMVAALASWHLSRFYFLVFVGCVTFHYLLARTEQVSLAKSLMVVVSFCFVGGILIPVLVTKGFLLSLPMLLSYALAFACAGRHFRNLSRLQTIFVFLAVLVVGGLLAYINGTSASSYSHVYAILLNKIRFFGGAPDNPALLPFDARIMWAAKTFQSPPASFTAFNFSILIPLGLISIFLLGKRKFKEGLNLKESFLLFHGLVFLVCYFVIVRLGTFLDFFLAVLIGRLVLLNWNKRGLAVGAMLFVCLCFEGHKVTHLRSHTLFTKSISKAFPPRERGIPKYLGADDDLIKWIRKNTEEGDVFLADPRVSTNILAFANRPVVLHPKWEAKLVKKKYADFLSAIFNHPYALYALCKNSNVKYVLYSIPMVMDHSKNSDRYIADALKLKRDSAAYKLHFEIGKLEHFTLAYQNRFYRLFEVHGRGERTEEMRKRAFLNLAIYNGGQYNAMGAGSAYYDDGVTPILLKQDYMFEAIRRSGL